MSGLQSRAEDSINGVDVREQGNALRVATNTPHLVSLGTGRLSTAVTLHPIKQGRVTIGSDPTCDIYILGPGVTPVHCRVENSNGVVTLYPISGTTLLDGALVDKPTRLSQGSMLTIGRVTYLRFNHPAEAMLMKSVLPSGHMSTEQYGADPSCKGNEYNNHYAEPHLYHQSQTPAAIKDPSLMQLDNELNVTLKSIAKKKPPVAPRKPYRDLDFSDSNSDQESKPKVSNIMAKVSKFEYYAKQQKTVGRSQFYTTHDNEISPKVFSSNSITVNTPAKDVLGGKNIPNYINRLKPDSKVVFVNDNNSLDAKSCSYANVTIRNNKTRIDDIVRNFDENTKYDNKLPKKVNNFCIDQQNEHIYGKINTEKVQEDNSRNLFKDSRTDLMGEDRNDTYGKICDQSVNVLAMKQGAQSNYDINHQYSSIYANSNYDRSVDAEHMRIKAYQDRVKEEKQKEAESARLEEILNMCAEYERQISSGVPITPPEKRSHNKIITNGSLPRSITLNNPNFVQTPDGYYKFDTSHSRSNTPSRSLPTQRNVSSYENYDVTQSPTYAEPNTPKVTIRNQSSYENVGRMDEIGIPVFEENTNELSSPIMIRKLQNSDSKIPQSPIGSPYENVYANRSNFKPKSPKTQSPRTRIKTTFAHKNLPSPQYFIFPTPPPRDSKPNFNVSDNQSPRSPKTKDSNVITSDSDNKSPSANMVTYTDKNIEPNKSEVVDLNNKHSKEQRFGGIEKQLSLEEEIPMIDDTDLTNDIECRHSRIDNDNSEISTNENTENNDNNKDDDVFMKKVIEVVTETTIVKNQSFDDVRKELMADIPELEEFENDLRQNKREVLINNLSNGIKSMDLEADSLDSAIVDDNVDELKAKYESFKEERRQLISEISEIKCKMSEIRAQEDDILRELEMEKALIKGEYDSEIAILNIEQKKKCDLVDKLKAIEEEIKQLKNKQDTRQNEMQDRVEIATLKVERITRDLNEAATEEELQNAQDILDNETKIYEDLEFQHLEEESELLANREDLQNELLKLTKKIDTQKTRILTLKSEASNNLTSALDETKILQAEYVRLLNQVEELTSKVQNIAKELKPIVQKLNDIERTQSPDSAFYTDQTRAKSGEYGYSPQSSDSDDLELSKIPNFAEQTKHLKDKFNSIDQMSQSMIVDIERRVITDIVDHDDTFNRSNESPTKSSTSKEKKGFWERNFDSLKRKSKDKKQKSPEKIDIMSQSLNENMFYNNENIENDAFIDRFNSLRNSKNKKDKKDNDKGPIKSNSSSKIPTFAALGKIIKKDSFGKKSRENTKETTTDNINKNRYVKNTKPSLDNKYLKSKSASPEKCNNDEIKTITEEIEIVDPSQTNKVPFNNLENGQINKILHRKSCGDDPNPRSSITDLKKISDSGKIPSRDDIDRISKVTTDAPLLFSDSDVISLGKRTFDSLKELEKRRMVMLEEQGCQVIENEREKISELKRRAQDETKKLWDQKLKREHTKSTDSDQCPSITSDINEINASPNSTRNSQDLNQVYGNLHNYSRNESLSSQYDGTKQNGGNRGENKMAAEAQVGEDISLIDDSFNVTSSTLYDDSYGFTSSSIEELQVRNSHAESEGDKRSDDSRPLSNASDFSRDNILSFPLPSNRAKRSIAPVSPWQRPLTRYLPTDSDDFDLRRHVQTAGHQIELCPHVNITSTSCRGYLHKLGAKFHTWSKRWFLFDRESKTFVYYWDKSEKKPRGGAYFQVIEEVYLDHGNTSKSPSPQTTFIVKTRQRRYYLMAPSGESARIWIDVIFTGAQGYMEYLE